MSGQGQTIKPCQQFAWRDALEMCKPRVVVLMVITALVGMWLSRQGAIPWGRFGLASVVIAFAAAASAVVNHVADRLYDQKMYRTQARPMAQSRVTVWQAASLSAVMGIVALVTAWLYISPLMAVLTIASMFGYAFIYSMYLKHATVQNIVIGGFAGAAPPLLGCVAITGHVTALSVVLMMIIVLWTPPHFWALAIARRDDYARAEIPMLPLLLGDEFTASAMCQYALMLAVMTYMPYFLGVSGIAYVVIASLLNAMFLTPIIRLWRGDSSVRPMKIFHLSIVYLTCLFPAMLLG